MNNIKEQLIKGKTHRLITSRYPPINIFENADSIEDAKAALLLETLTNNRINPLLERLNKLPEREYVVGSGSGYIMAAFLHGMEGRFNDHTIGAWYASFDLHTAIQETVYHHTLRLKKEEGGLHNTTIEMRQLLSSVNNKFHDITTKNKSLTEIYNPLCYKKPQEFAGKLKQKNTNGICYKSVRRDEGKNIAIFKPSLIKNLIQGDHFEYKWVGEETPIIAKKKIINL